MSGLISVVVVLVVVGFALWMLNTYIPMQPPIKTIINALIVLVLVLWILQAFGLVHVPLH